MATTLIGTDADQVPTNGMLGDLAFMDTAGLNVAALLDVAALPSLGAGAVTATGSTTARTLAARFADVVNARDFGAAGDGVADDTAALQAFFLACVGKTGVLPPGTYRTNGLNLNGNHHDMHIVGYGATIAPVSGDGIIIYGGTGGGAPAHDIVFEGLRIAGATGSGFNVYSPSPNRTNCYNLTFKGTHTTGCVVGGIFIRSAKRTLIDGHVDAGSDRGISVMSRGSAATAGGDWTEVDGCTITNCRLTGQTQYGIQTYYGANYVISSNFLDGAANTSGEGAHLNVDRSRHVTVLGNTVQDSTKVNIQFYAAQDVTCSGNTLLNGGCGVMVKWNGEYVDDPTIDEAARVTVVGNMCYGQVGPSIVFNGVSGGTIVGNVCVSSDPSQGLLVMDATRSEDGQLMASTDISVIGNTIVGNRLKTTVSNPVFFSGNAYSSLAGPNGYDVLVEREQAQLPSGTRVGRALTNYLEVHGHASGNPYIAAKGAGANVGLSLYAKGASGFGLFLQDGGDQIADAYRGSGSAGVSRVSLVARSDSVQVASAGSAADLDVQLVPKGSGAARFGTHTANADAAITGYVTIKTADGTLRKLAVIS